MKKTFCKKRPDKSSLHHRPALPALCLYRKPALPALCLILCLVLAGCASKAGPGEGTGTAVTKEAGAADAEAVSGSGTGGGVQAVDAEAAAASGYGSVHPDAAEKVRKNAAGTEGKVKQTSA